MPISGLGAGRACDTDSLMKILSCLLSPAFRVRIPRATVMPRLSEANHGGDAAAFCPICVTNPSGIAISDDACINMTRSS